MRAPYLATICLALLGPWAIAATTSSARWRRRPIIANVAAQILLGATTVVAVSLSIGALHAPRDSIGLRLPNWRSPLLAVGLAALFILVIGPRLSMLPHLLGCRDVERGLADLTKIPLGLLVGAIFVVATIEEVLYRGIGYGLLAESVGPVWAVVLTSIAFSVAHLPLWGAGASLTIGLGGGAVFASFDALSGDLWSNALAHIVVDLAGIVSTRLRGDRTEFP